MKNLEDYAVEINDYRDRILEVRLELKRELQELMVEAKEAYGATALAKALGISRHRVYQIINEELEDGATND